MMMFPRLSAWALLSCLSLGMTTPLSAQVKGSGELYWYDGGIKRPVFVDDAHVADFSGGERTKSAVVKSMPGTKTMAAGQSPLLRDGNDPESRARALPGGVIVRLRQVLPEDQARAYLEQRGLKAVREIGTQTGLWLVESEPGLPSLQLANQLHEKGEFASASPNWWQPRALK